MNNDRITELYDGEIGPPESQQRARTRIHWLCARAEGDVLDVGCSQGIASILLAREGHRVTGIDVEGAALAFARERLEQEEAHVAERVTFTFAEGSHLPFEDASFDTVLMGELLEHQVDAGPLLREARRVLKDDGTLVLTFRYGIFRYPDHKEPLYLRPVLGLLEDRYAIERIELVERWIGVVARAADAAEAGLSAAAWAEALDAAETRLADLDAASEARRESLRRAQARLDAETEARAGDRVALAEAQARQAATMRELDLVQTRLRGVEAEARQAHRARLEAERTLAVAEGRVRAADEDAERRMAGALESLRMQLAEARAELTLAHDRIAFLGEQREEQDQALRAADDRAAAVTRELAVTQVELEAARNRAPSNGASRAVAGASDDDEEGDPGHWLRRGQALRVEKRLPEAMAAYTRALELRPGWPEALWPALWVQARLGSPSDFEALAAGLGRLRRDGLERLAPLALRAGAHDLALSVGDRLLAIDPHGETAILTAAAANWELGREDEADAIVARAVERDDPRAVRAAIGFRRHTDRLDEVPALVARLKRPDPKLRAEVGRTFLRSGQPAPALDVLGRGGGERLDELRKEARADLRLYDGSWAPRHGPRRVEPERGRVLHLVSHSLPQHTSGGTYRTHAIARAQLAAGMRPAVVTPLGFGGAQRADTLDGITYRRLPDAGGDGSAAARLGRNLDALLPLVEELRPAALHAHSDHRNAKLALELGRIFGLPVVYEVRGFPEERRVRRAGSRATSDPGVGRRALELECMTAADRIVTLAEVMKRHMVDRGVDGDKIRIVPNGVDPDALAPAARDAALAARLGLGDAEAVLGYVSTFHGYEGIDTTVRATAELLRRGRRVRALLVGDGREGPALKALAAELGIAGAVVFTGRVPHEEIAAYYGLIDLFVVARRAEATSELVTPLKPYEAMALERPVLASDLAALREIVRDGATGRTFRPDDPVHLADVAEQLIADPGERARLAAAGRAWVLAERTWSANAERYRRLYAELGAI